MLIAKLEGTGFCGFGFGFRVKGMWRKVVK